MIERVDLTHFKCFEVMKLPLSQLTLLSGTNASGKSSILHALVLLHQTMREHEWSTRLILNGETINLGTVAEVIDKVHGRNRFEIELIADGHVYCWDFHGERAEMSLALHELKIDGVSVLGPFRHLLPINSQDPAMTRMAHRLRDLTYITAERIGPREFYPLEDKQTASVVGATGEYAISLLQSGRDEEVLDDLRIEGVSPTRLRQVEARMADFFPGCGMKLEPVPHMNAVTLGLRTSEETDYHRPVHEGFGLTQVMPIVIAALSAAREDLLLIENPEVHLHPAGQVRMGQFLADVARAGVQVIVETHSDHILSGVRRAVRAQRVTPEQVALHFFKTRYSDGSQCMSPQLDTLGNIDVWPEGFFDQFDKDMNHFAGWGE